MPSSAKGARSSARSLGSSSPFLLHFDHGQVAAARAELDDERLHEERPAHGVLRARDVGVRREDGRADHALVAKVRLGEMVPQILQALEERMVGKNPRLLASSQEPRILSQSARVS